MGSNAGNVDTSGLFATAGDAAGTSGGPDPAFSNADVTNVPKILGAAGKGLSAAGKGMAEAQVPGGGAMPGIDPGASDIWSDPQFMREVFMMLIPQQGKSGGKGGR